MDAYRDEGMGDVIVGEPFLKEIRIEARRFDGMITIYNGNEEVTYQMVRSYPRFKYHTNVQCNKIPPLLKSIFSLCYLFRNPFSSTTIGDQNPIRTLGDYSKPSHDGYRNTIELPVGNNVVPLRSNTIQLVQNGCSFYELRSKDPNQHLKDFLKLVDSLDIDSDNRERTRLCLFQFSLRDQASNWLERLSAGSITTWEDLATRFLAQFFPSGRTAKLRNDILMFQQHHGESLSKAWTLRFTNGDDEVSYKMPHKIEQYNSLSNLEKEHTKSVYLRNEEDKRRGVDYVMSKILGFYEECLVLGPEYATGLEDEEEVMLYLMRRNLEVLRKFHWMILGGRFNQLSHVSSPLLSKPREY
ncbi:zinc finger, CCHC-type containing protein [Tanacetum coccineum]